MEIRKDHRATLTEEQVKEIRRRFSEGEKQTDLMKEFGVSQSCISNIIRRKTWDRI